MNKSRSFILTVAIFAFFCELGILPPAHAYIDPGTGQYVISLVIAFIAGIGFGIKIYWQKITQWFRNTFTGKQGE